jgi:hypothetical protein
MKLIVTILIAVILSLALSNIVGLPKTASALPPSDCKGIMAWADDCIPRIIRTFIIGPLPCPNCGHLVLDKHFLDSIVNPGDGNIIPGGPGNLAIFVHPGVHGYNVTSILAGDNSTVVRTFSLPLLMNQSSTNSGLK